MNPGFFRNTRPATATSNPFLNNSFACLLEVIDPTVATGILSPSFSFTVKAKGD